MQILTWLCDDSSYHDYNGIIADGSIRAGKTVVMAVSFVIWAMDSYDGQNFAICGKTVGSFRRNVWKWLKPVLLVCGYQAEESRTENLIVVARKQGSTMKLNYFYVFGGCDESSQDGLETHQYMFGGLADCYQQFIMDISGAAEIPVTRLFGSSSSGLNATGESGLRITTT